MGLPFDKEYTWADAKIYCSELIAKILNFAPLPFTKDESEGERRVGISPDDLREILKNQGFERVTTGEACYFNARSFLSQSD